MVVFNLLPEHQLRKALLLKKMQRMLALVFLFSVLLMFFVHFYLIHKIEKNTARDVLLQTEIDHLLALKQNEADVYENAQTLQHYQAEALHYLINAAQTLALLVDENEKTICFTSLTRNKNEMTLQGYALSIEDLLAKLSLLRQSNHFVTLHLVSMNWLADDNVLQFEVKGEQTGGFRDAL